MHLIAIGALGALVATAILILETCNDDSLAEDADTHNSDGDEDVDEDTYVDCGNGWQCPESYCDNPNETFCEFIGNADSDADTDIDTDGDSSTCDMGPRVFEGDGNYEVRTGDRIIANNEVSFLIRGPSSEECTIFGADFYIGEEQLTFLPIPFYHESCAETYGISFTRSVLQITDCGCSQNIEFVSTYPGPITSRQDLYFNCRETERPHSQCADFIPYEPTSTETMYSEGPFQVIVPSGVDPEIGTYYLAQLQHAYDPLVEFFGVEEILPHISLRWYLPDGSFSFPNTNYQIKWSSIEESEVEFIREEEAGGLDNIASNNIVVHELKHLLDYHLRIPYWLSEGLARYAEVYVTQRPPPPIPPILEEAISLNQPLLIPATDYPLEIEFTEYNFEDRSAFEATTGFWFKERSSLLLNENTLLIVDTVDDDNFTVRVFQDEERIDRYHGWVFDQLTQCFETDYIQHSGIWFGDTFYQTARRDDAVVIPQDYVSLSEGHAEGGYSPFYETAFCLFQGLRELYGHEVIRSFLQEADHVRRESMETNSLSLFCATEALENAVGEDLSGYFSRFEPPTGCSYNFENTPIFGRYSCPNEP